MNKILYFIGDKFLNNRLDFRVKLYNILAMAGTIIGTLMAASCVYTNASFWNVLVSIASAAFSFGLLLYSNSSGKYQRCYMLSIIVIFLVIFPALFFTAGGYHSGMPSFFVFAVLFTVLMLDGKKMAIMAALEMLVYIIICFIAYTFPETVRPFLSEWDIMSDIIIGFLTVSIALGITMFLHFRLYNIQQCELEAAREEALRLSEAKSHFLANMSHEIRTPINVMIGMNEMIMHENESAQIHDYSVKIQKSGENLLLMIDNILDMSKIEQGKLEVIPNDYFTHELIDELSLIGEGYAGRRGLLFLIEVDDSLPCKLMGDIIRVKQVISNFLSNAAKYTAQGSITLSFSGKPGNIPEQINLCVSVADTGTGIKPDAIPVLFEAFTRVDLHKNRHIEGTGLGLSIAKELTELMSGRVYVKSQWGKGSIFSAEIPQIILDRTPCGGQPQLQAMHEDDNTRKGYFIAPDGMILIVDDNHENLSVIKALLARTLLHVDTATSGEECLNAVKEKNYDAIIIDYMMPGLDGVETLQLLQENPDFQTPVMALTANVVAGVKEKLLSVGFQRYLTKPISWRELEYALICVLPKELVIKNISSNPVLLDYQVIDELASELALYGVTLDNGLRYLSGDISQYKKLAKIFIKNYYFERQTTEENVKKKDWKLLKFTVHAIKSKAKAIGARDLSDTASKLERLCDAVNDEYITIVLLSLYYEWERTYEGLTRFTLKIDKLYPDDSSPEKPMENGPGINELLTMLKYNRQPDAITAINRLIVQNSIQSEKEILRKARQKIKKMNLRDAEYYLSILAQGDANEP